MTNEDMEDDFLRLVSKPHPIVAFRCYAEFAASDQASWSLSRFESTVPFSEDPESQLIFLT